MKKILTILLLLAIFSCSKEDWNLKKLPKVSEVITKDNTFTSLSLESNLLHDGHDKNTLTGFCWSINPDPTLEDNVAYCNLENESFQLNLNWANLNSQHVYLRSFATNSVGIRYSNALDIYNPATAYELPTVVTELTDPLNVHMSIASIPGTIISNGGLPIIEYGIVFSSSNNNPEIGGLNVQVSSIPADHIGLFEIQLTGLTDNTTYVYRAYARTLAGLIYGYAQSFTTIEDYNIGDVGPGGGLIFFRTEVSTEGWHFMEATQQDLLAMNWSNQSITTGVTGLFVGAGLQNSFDIVNNSIGIYTAAGYCLQYNPSPGDWYLPSRDELLLMYQNLHAIGDGNFAPTGYWSSSEDENFPQNAWQVNFQSGSAHSDSKTETRNIRAARRF